MSRKVSAMTWTSVLAVLFTAVVLYLFVSHEPVTSLDHKPAPEFTYPDTTGRDIALSSLRGKVVLLDFWATWCQPCLEELPDLMRFHEAHKAKGFSVVGVATDAEGQSVVAAFSHQSKIPYPVLVSSGELPKGYPIPGLPTAFLIDKNGVIVRRYLGGKSYEELEKDLAEVMSPATATP